MQQGCPVTKNTPGIPTAQCKNRKSTLQSQEFNDWIITQNNDTIFCNITFINDQNIFYNYKKRKAIKSDFNSRYQITGFHAEDKVKVQYIIDDVIFYGYDFTDFKINDVKRIDQNISNFILIWIDHLNKTIKPEDIESLMDFGKVTNH